MITDELNHASIIDGIRLCKAKRYRYANRDMADLEAQLKAAADARRRLIATDGVFSMDGYVAPLARDLRAGRQATTRWSWSTTRTRSASSARPGAVRLSCTASPTGSTSSPAPSARRSAARAAATPAAAAEIVDLLRQRSRPYLFSNSLAPAIVGASLKVLDLLESGDDLRTRLRDNTTCVP